MAKIKKVAVIGDGMIGSSMATLFAGNSYPVLIVGVEMERCQAALKNVEQNLDDLVKEGLISEAGKRGAMKLVSVSVDYADMKDADICFEAVFEDPEVKKGVYEKTEQYVRDDVVIASVTSAISADVLGEFFTHKERFVVAHPWNPPHLVPLVEVCRSKYTSDETVKTVQEFLDGIGRKTVVLKKNIEGFIGNRLQHAMFREALYLMEAGVATAEDIDDVVYYGFGPRYSELKLMEHFDCAGLPLHKQVESTLFPTLCNATGPQKVLLDCIAEGKLGMKTGEGVLKWKNIDMDDFRERQRRPFYKFVKWNLPEDQ